MKFDSREMLVIGLMAGAIGVSVCVLSVQLSAEPSATDATANAETVAAVAESGSAAIFSPHPAQGEPRAAVQTPATTPNAAIRTQKPRDLKIATRAESAAPAEERPYRRVIIQTFPPAPIPGQPATAGRGVPSELQIDLAPGVREPIALTADVSELPPQQIPALEGIANDFADRIEQAAEFYSEAEFAATWDAEQANADAQFYALFGAEAYNRKMADVAAAGPAAAKPAEQNAAATK